MHYFWKLFLENGCIYLFNNWENGLITYWALNVYRTCFFKFWQINCYFECFKIFSWKKTHSSENIIWKYQYSQSNSDIHDMCSDQFFIRARPTAKGKAIHLICKPSKAGGNCDWGPSVHPSGFEVTIPCNLVIFYKIPIDIVGLLFNTSIILNIQFDMETFVLYLPALLYTSDYSIM